MGGKAKNAENDPQSWEENQQQTQPMCDAVPRKQTGATLVGVECPHHCTIPASPKYYFTEYYVTE